MSSRPTSLRGRCAVLVLSLAVGGCASQPPSPSPVPEVAAAPSIPAASPSPEPTPTALPSASDVPSATLDPTIADLTGLTTDATRAHRLPLAVLIDDNRVARPQSGFNGASIVYQAPADGGETRYMLVFQETDAAQIGPVRSARFYFVHWATEIRAAIAHYGGERRSRRSSATYDGDRFTNVDALGAGQAHSTGSRAGTRRTTATPRPRPCGRWPRDSARPASEPAALDRRPFIDPTTGGPAGIAADRDPVPDRLGRVPVRPCHGPLSPVARWQGAGRSGRRPRRHDAQRGRPVHDVPHRHEGRARPLPTDHRRHRHGPGARLPRGPRRRRHVVQDRTSCPRRCCSMPPGQRFPSSPAGPSSRSSRREQRSTSLPESRTRRMGLRATHGRLGPL